MKTKLFLGIAAMALFSSCEDLFEEKKTVIDISEIESDMTFSAVTESTDSTRSSLSDKTNSAGYYSLYWTRGDAISISSDGMSTAIFTTEDEGTPFAEFTRKEGRIGSGATYMAFYPSSITPSHMVLPAEQKYVANNIKDFPMYAESKTKELKFKNLCGIIRLSLKSEETGSIEVSSISLSADNAGMSGSFIIGEDDYAIVDGSDGVVLTCEKAIPLHESLETDFNIVVPQGDYNPLRVKISDAAGKEMNLVSEDRVHVERSGITKIALTLGASSFDSSLEMIPITESDVEFTER